MLFGVVAAQVWKPTNTSANLSLPKDSLIISGDFEQFAQHVQGIAGSPPGQWQVVHIGSNNAGVKCLWSHQPMRLVHAGQQIAFSVGIGKAKDFCRDILPRLSQDAAVFHNDNGLTLCPFEPRVIYGSQ